jgi:nitrile hydratase subunit alpha
MTHDHHHPSHHAPPGEHELLTEAVIALLERKGVIAPGDVWRMVEEVDRAGETGPGEAARVVARAWVDPAYRSRLLATPKAALAEQGVEIGATELYVVESTPEVHNLIVCTLCSCYPKSLLGRPPVWYKSFAYRARAVREPRAVLRAFGTEVPEATEVRVHDSSADLRYMVLPMRPAGTDGWSESRLAALVTRDSLIGVRPATPPDGA